MKIAFIVGNLEPGKDGVGDYSRRLAAECIRQGNSCLSISFNDSRVSKITVELQEIEGMSVPALRLPSVMSWAKRIAAARQKLDEFDPDWLSLQFVPFGFNRKGLCFRLGTRFLTLSRKASWHIMFHELWVGMEIGASAKFVWWGKLQRHIIYLMVKKLRPAVMHTQTTLHARQLNTLGYRSKHLPLFSNIPVLRRPEISLKPNQRGLAFVVFGTIHSDAPIEPFVREMARYKEKYDVNTKVIFLGRSGKELQYWLDVCGKIGLATEFLGEKTPLDISQILSECEYGISTTPVVQAGKSGTIAAMLEHGLPVICLRELEIKDFEIGKSQPGILAYRPGNLEDLLRLPRSAFPGYDIQTIAAKFLESLV